MIRETARRFVNDQSDIGTHAHRPEVLVARLVELVELHSRIGRAHLQIKRRRLDGLLLVTGQPGEAVGERIGDAEFHAIGWDWPVQQVYCAASRVATGCGTKPSAYPLRITNGYHGYFWIYSEGGAPVLTCQGVGSVQLNLPIVQRSRHSARIVVADHFLP